MLSLAVTWSSSGGVAICYVPYFRFRWSSKWRTKGQHGFHIACIHKQTYGEAVLFWGEVWYLRLLDFSHHNICQCTVQKLQPSSGVIMFDKNVMITKNIYYLQYCKIVTNIKSLLAVDLDPWCLHRWNHNLVIFVNYRCSSIPCAALYNCKETYRWLYLASSYLVCSLPEQLSQMFDTCVLCPPCICNIHAINIIHINR